MMEDKPVGLLWDSVSNNIGDQAIGLVMQGFLKSKGIRHEVVNPFSYDPLNYSTMIIGGGELLRDKGDPFYDCFRAYGAHILNSVGSYRPDHMEYLKDYKLVTVRSEADRKLLEATIPNTGVVPCTTLVMKDFIEGEIKPLYQIAKNAIGIHLNLSSSSLILDLIPFLRQIQLQQQRRIVLLPFTNYQHDQRVMEVVARSLPGVLILPAQGPIDAFQVIGQLKALVCSSLHASIFAYGQNIPVLAFPSAPKVRYFFEERGLDTLIYTTTDELIAKFNNMLENPPDFSAKVKEDQEAIYAHLESLTNLLGEQKTNGPVENPIELKNRLSEASNRYHDLTMQGLERWANMLAGIIELQLANRQKDQAIQTMQKRITELESLFPFSTW